MRFNELRKSKRMALSELASRSKLSYYTVRAYGRGIRNPTLGSLRKITVGLGLDATEAHELQFLLTDNIITIPTYRWTKFNEEGIPAGGQA